MKKALDILYKSLSIALYPMLIPTYGMVMFCTAISRTVLPLSAGYSVIVCVTTLCLTCFIPLGMILIMRRHGQIDSLYLKDREQRLRPYLYSIAGFVVWCVFIGRTLHAPLYVLLTAIGATVATGIVTLVNTRWKISAHLCAMGGLTGGILSFGLAMCVWPMVMLTVVLALSLLLMYARIWLDAHTPEQVVAGYLTGLACTVTPNVIMYV